MKGLLLALAAVAAIVFGVLLFTVLGSDPSPGAAPGEPAPAVAPANRGTLRTSVVPRAVSDSDSDAVTPSRTPIDARRPPEEEEEAVDLDARFPVADCIDPPRLTEAGELDATADRALLGRVVDGDGAGVESARVVAIPRGNPNERVEATTVENGEFRLVVRTADEDRDLEVTHADFGRKTFRVRPSRRTEDGLEVPIGDLVLEPAGSISGLVQIADGSPGAGLEVVLKGPNPGFAPMAEIVGPAHQFALRRAKADGSFAFERLAPGEYSIGVHPEAGRGLAEVEQTFELEAGQNVANLTLVLRATGEVEITVVTPDGRPVAGLVVSIEVADPTSEAAAQSPGAKSAATGVDGRVRFSNAIPGRYRTHVDGQGATAVDRAGTEFDVPADGAGTVRLTVTVRPTQSISGRVVDSNGDPVMNVAVIAAATGSNAEDPHPQPRTALTAQDGTFTIGGLDEAEYRIDVMDLGADAESRVLGTREGVLAGSTDVEIAISR